MRPHVPGILLALSLALNSLFALGSVAVVQSMGGLPWLRRELAELLPLLRSHEIPADYAHNMQSLFAQLPIGPHDIVLLGDSILDYGEWHEFLANPHARNRAINGDDTRTILPRLDQITRGRPRHVVLLCGINNIQNHVSYAQTTREYARIVATITSRSARTDVWLLPVLPINTRLYRKWIVPDMDFLHTPAREEVVALDTFIRTLAVDRPRIHFVDLPGLLDPAGELRQECTSDGIHLNGRGLEQVALRLRQELPGND
jgi:lysophospholipase L1-like esterase